MNKNKLKRIAKETENAPNKFPPHKRPAASHTPTPWETGGRLTRVEVLPKGWNRPICIADCDTKTAPDNELEKCANAAFIVKAVNAHEAAMDSLRYIDYAIGGEENEEYADEEVLEIRITGKAIKDLKAALKKGA